MSERRVDLRQVAHVHEDERERRRRVVLQHAVELNLRERAVRQAGERVVIREMRDAVLAIGDLDCIALNVEASWRNSFAPLTGTGLS